VLALANVAPEQASTVYEIARDDPAAAREHGAQLVELNHAVTAEYGVPGLKYAMRRRGAPAGHARSPHQPPDETARERLDTLLDALPDS
jgi:Dihydrodipicolinate synthase/N-acetylneuraminate lyase